MRARLTILAALMPAAALASDPTGLWATASNEDGAYLEVRIAPCASDAALLCGVIERAVDGTGTAADYPHLGRVMIRNMAPDGPGAWSDGTIWAPDEDETYASKMALTGAVLTVSGCVMAGLVCRGQDWRRVERP